MAKKIFFFPRYSSKAPSSRYRIYNYLEYYRNNGYEVYVYPLFGDWYLNCIWNHVGKWSIIHKIFFAYLKRLILLLFLPKKSLVYIGAELFPYLPYNAESILLRKGIKFILDFDDAVFHYYDLNPKAIVRKFLGQKTNKAISSAYCIITGSEYLTNYATNFNSSVVEIPTAIDATKYLNQELVVEEEFIIGWIGSFSQSKQIIEIIPALKRLSENYRFRLHLVGFDPILEHHLQGIPYLIIDWNEMTEVLNMKAFSVGIMPLDDSPFSNGKCAFKLVQYMAVGIPTISTPLQSNININRYSGNLFARTQDEWYLAFEEVMHHQEKFKEIGIMNRNIAFKYYTIQANLETYLNIFKDSGIYE